MGFAHGVFQWGGHMPPDKCDSGPSAARLRGGRRLRLPRTR
ncbi:hypothetical protein NH44784_055871 [Achromobacter xylosoxidans NH44784-1996]|nr:hypothetical protein NH44784_055871 [Achromobacter xylosoxidans NH44784-1996]